MQCMWFFSTPYTVVVIFNEPTQVELSFVKKKIHPIYKPLFVKNKVADYRTATQLAANKTETGQWTCDEGLGKCWKIPLQEKGGKGEGSFLYSCFSTYTPYISLGCVSYSILCIPSALYHLLLIAQIHSAIMLNEHLLNFCRQVNYAIHQDHSPPHSSTAYQTGEVPVTHLQLVWKLTLNLLYYYHHHHHRISHFSALAGKYSPILGCGNL